jgi:tetratricopeptide (TPR) repeat protein
LTFYGFLGFSQGNEKELLAQEYMNAGQYDKAIVLFEEIYSKNSSTYIYDSYLECLLKTEDWKAAEKLIQKHKRNNPLIPRFYVDEGYVQLLQNNIKQSDKIFNDAIKWAISSEQLIIDLSNAFQIRELNNWAIQTLSAGKKQFPQSTTLKIQLAGLYMKAGKYSEMLDEYFILLENPFFGVEELQKHIQSLLMEDRDGQISITFKNKLLEKIQKYPSNPDYNRLLVWNYELNGEFEKAFIQAKAYDKRTKNDGDFSFDVAQLCVSNKNYTIAEDALSFIVSLGSDKSLFDDANDLLLEVKYLKLTDNPASQKSDFIALSEELKQSLNNSTYKRNRYKTLMRLAYIEAFYISQPDAALSHLNQIINTPGYQPYEYANAKMLQGDIMLLKDEVWEASLLYSQVEKAFKNDTLGFYAKFKNARLYYFLGEFDYASAQLEILRGATSKLIANDAMELFLVIQENVDEDSSYVPLEKFAKANMLAFCLKYDDALLVLDTILKSFPNHPILDDAIYKRAEIYMALKQYDKAASELKTIISAYYYDILADNALFMLGNIYEYYIPDKEQAMKYYLQLISDFPGSILINDARQHYRAIRGDNLN